ncbi:MAG TPA: L,D-transpeptidase family protein [Blastocatellia bacterium]|nr:L,D-transpeptidase family protein [Blastocatellia bacterium]
MSGALIVKIARAIGAAMLISAILVTTVTNCTGEVKRPGSERRVLPKKARVTPQMIREAQQRLISLGYWIREPNGKWGESSRHGLIAFQKVERRPRTGRLTRDELQALMAASRPSPRERGFDHIEVDLTRQVLFIVEADGTVSRILPVSTGNGKPFTLDNYTQPAVTPAGHFRVYRKLSGWRKSPLGLLYYPNYIVGGIAIHGNPSVPARPASHGCIRIPMYASEEFSKMTPVGTQVIVHGDSVHAAQSLEPRN